MRLVDTAAPRLMEAGISVLLPSHLGRRHTSSRSYHVRGTATGFDVANLILTGEVRVGDTTLTPAELDALVTSQHDLVSLGGRFTLLADGVRALYIVDS